MLLRRIFLFAALTIMSALFLTAQQTGSGTVQGVVKDASSAVVAGARVTLVHTATTTKYSTTTNDVGFFSFPPVQPGDYTIVVEVAGMQTWEGKFLLQVGQTVEISPVLNVGSLTTQVTIAEQVAPLVATTDATLSVNLEHARIEQLPQNGRSISSLVLLSTPGLAGGQDGSINPINTGLRDSVELYQDGAVIKNRDTGDWSGRLPGVDSVEEVRVETSLSSAKFDRPGSVILSTRSGSNTVHGTAFETARNSGIGVARARTDYYTKPPHYVRNEFGGSLGGPVYLPKLYNGKNRTFFFTSYEVYRVASASTNSTSMPTMAMRQGDFSGLVDSVGHQYILYDPWTTGAGPTYQRTPFPNNQIPVTREGPNAKYLYSIMPAPTNNANPMVANNYYGLAPSHTSDYMSTSRIDQRISDRDQVFGRFSINGDQTIYANGVASTNYALNSVLGTYTDGSGAFTWTHSFSPTSLSETQVSFSRQHKFVGTPSVAGISNMTDYLGEPNPQNNPFQNYSTSGMGFSLNFSGQQVRQNTSNIFVLSQNFTRIHGRHEIQFGGRIHYEGLNTLVDQPGTSVTYTNLATGLFDPTSGSSYSAVPYTGYSAASFFLGTAGTYKATFKRPAFDLHDREYAGYIQDNWKATSKLTLNFGLRYEYLPAQKVDGDFQIGFDKNTDAMVLGRPLDDMYKAGMTTTTAIAALQRIGVKFETYSQAGLPQSLVYGNPWNFEPRAGFAYRVGQTVRPFVVRGGYGLYNSQTALRVWDNLVGSGIPYGYPLQYAVSNQATAPDGLPNYELRSAPQYVAGVSSRNILNDPNLALITPGCCALQYVDPHQRPSLSQQWNLSFEREILQDIVAKASYVGTHAQHLPQMYNFNAAPPDYVWYAKTGLAKPTGTYASTGTNSYDTTTYGSLTEYMKTGISNANSVRLEVQRRYSHGYGFQFFYVMTNAFTNSTLVGNGGGPTITPAATYLPGAVPTDFNALDRSLYYDRDTAIPHHQLAWNWVADLPFGQGKLLGRNAGKVLNRVIGGWQIAGAGSYQSRYFTLPTSNWITGQVQSYGTQYKVQDCSSGTCIPGYLAWNGYISPPLINRTNAAGQCTGICGLPANYVASNQPLITWGATALPANAPANTNLSSYWETNTVWVPLKDGTVVRTTYNTNYNPWQNQFVAAPWSFSLNASLFKSIDLTEAVKLRFNADFFSVLNNPGLSTPSSNGILYTNTSSNSPRVLQLTLRLSW